MHWKIALLALTLALPAAAQNAPSTGKRPFTFEDMMALKRVSDPQPSPDGKWVVFSAVEVDLAENTRKSRLWIVPAEGGKSRRLNPTENEEERPAFFARWKAAHLQLEGDGPGANLDAAISMETRARSAGESRQLTTISTGADGGIWSPDGKNIVFVSKVYPDCKDDACNQQRDEEQKNSKVKAQVFDKLLYRHWNAFSDSKRSHLFVHRCRLDGGARPHAGQSRRAALQPRRAGSLRDLAGWAGSRLHEQR